MNRFHSYSAPPPDNPTYKMMLFDDEMSGEESIDVIQKEEMFDSWSSDADMADDESKLWRKDFLDMIQKKRSMKETLNSWSYLIKLPRHDISQYASTIKYMGEPGPHALPAQSPPSFKYLVEELKRHKRIEISFVRIQVCTIKYLMPEFMPYGVTKTTTYTTRVDYTGSIPTLVDSRPWARVHLFVYYENLSKHNKLYPNNHIVIC